MRTIIINKRRITATIACLLGVSLITGWTAAQAAHIYTITIDKKIEKMTVEARFDRPIHYISARSRSAGQFLDAAHDCDRGEQITARSRTLRLPTEGIRCLSYSVNLRNAARAERLSGILDASSIVASPTVWMWRPRLNRDDELLATFELPDKASVFVPWQLLDSASNQYRLTGSPESGSAIAVFGVMDKQVVQVANAELTVVLLKTDAKLASDPLLSWVRATAENIVQTYGRFPNPNTNVVLIPVSDYSWNSERAVPFGRVVRDGGETVELMINQSKPIADYYKEWTPTHEFSHLMLPYLDRNQRWISEGFAQYYQNILLARAGQHSAEDAWQKIYDGLERGRESAPGMSPNEAASADERNTRMRIYWSGAALALMADVELRRRSGGNESLDVVLGRFQSCCLPSARSWSGVELFRKFDDLVEEPLFMDLYRRYADSNEFPDSAPLLKLLGIEVRDGQVQLDDGAELAALRDAMLHDAEAH